MRNQAAAQIPTLLTMSSREIADLANKRLDHVLRDIEKMLQELVETSPQFMGASKRAVLAIFTDSVNDDEAPACGLRYALVLKSSSCACQLANSFRELASKLKLRDLHQLLNSFGWMVARINLCPALRWCCSPKRADCSQSAYVVNAVIPSVIKRFIASNSASRNQMTLTTDAGNAWWSISTPFVLVYVQTFSIVLCKAFSFFPKEAA